MHAAVPSPTKIAATTFTPPVASQYVAHVDQTYTLQVNNTPVDEHNIVRVDAWEEGLCGCFSSCVNCCMAACLPCVSLAQIAQRIGWGKYWHVLLALLGLYFAELFITQLVLSSSYHTYWFNYQSYDYDRYRASSSYSYSWSSPFSDSTTDDMDGLYVIFIVSTVAGAVLGLCSFLGSLTGLVLIFVTWALRSRVRTLFNIPGSCCGDCFASCCCSCCAVAQMATHVKSYKKGNCDFGPVDTLPAFLPQ
jgi:Cys-rich protein (TIGR01571 family)